jgi:DNA-binding CsgD family transcriptional regulator
VFYRFTVGQTADSDMITAKLIDAVYEAGAIPELWPRAFEEIGRSFGTAGGLLFVVSEAGMEWTGGGGVADYFPSFLAGEGMRLNDRPQRLIGMRHMGFVADFHTQAEIDSLPMYTEHLAPLGYCYPAGTAAPGLDGTTFVFSVEGFDSLEAARAAVPALDQLRPHFARAASTSAQLGVARAKATVEALATLGAAAAVVGRGRRLVAANEPFERELGGRIFDRRTGVELFDATAGARLRETLDRIDWGHKAGCSIALRGKEEAKPAVLHVAPMPGRARDIFSGGLALLTLASGRDRPLLGDGVLEALFDLTPAEARLARALAAGETLGTASAERGVSIETSRVHLKRIFDKVGTSRQTELIALLRDLSASTEQTA